MAVVDEVDAVFGPHVAQHVHGVVQVAERHHLRETKCVKENRRDMNKSRRNLSAHEVVEPVGGVGEEEDSRPLASRNLVRQLVQKGEGALNAVLRHSFDMRVSGC